MQQFKQSSALPIKGSELNHFSALDHPFNVSGSGAGEERDYLRNAEWTMLEKARYFAFIDLNCKKMEGKPHGKLWPLYQEMAKLVKSRNFRQCKSHHQKMVDAHNTIPEIISYLVSSCPGIQQLAQKEKGHLLKIDMKSNLRVCTNVQKTQKKTAVEAESGKQIPSIQGALKNQEEEWKECHQLFVEWTHRLRNLMWQPPTTLV